ncbi:hypothetical protein M045_gp60 [Mycobacterium phage HINdeR]|uniref:Uncharacterized protein n=1 Tax=Mycobacterium phage HINdeR TaxID=1327770 RepID=R4JGB9_9CAUD|nr:hypothetical protein M045_gp60 [Mycobacterium phage HINdeR]AGK87539.1 hypothetical protein PBI_HINDER_60 [Mycobacterium phage HINdeR]
MKLRIWKNKPHTETAVYIPKPDGNYVAVYVGEVYRDGYFIWDDVPRAQAKRMTNVRKVKV